MTHSPDERLAYSPAEAAEVIGCSRAYMYELIATGKVTARKLGSRTLVLRTELERFLELLPTRS